MEGKNTHSPVSQPPESPQDSGMQNATSWGRGLGLCQATPRDTRMGGMEGWRDGWKEDGRREGTPSSPSPNRKSERSSHVELQDPIQPI